MIVILIIIYYCGLRFSLPAVKTSIPRVAVAPASAAIDELYRDHQPWLFRWLRGKLGNPFRAEDLTQDVFVRVIAGRKSVHAEQARPFLRTIAQGLLIDHYRRAGLEQAYLDYLAALPASYQPSAEVRVSVLQQIAALDRMLADLPDKVRRAFVMAQIDGLSYPEIAERLGVSLSSVQQYMTRALMACYVCVQG